MKRSTFIGFALGIALAAALAILPSCNSAQIDKANQQMANVQTDLAALQQELADAKAKAAAAQEAAATQPDGPAKDAAVKKAEAAEAVADKIAPAIATAKAALAELQKAVSNADPANKVDQGLSISQGVFGALSTVWPVLGPIAGVLGLIRAGITRSNARKIVQSLELAQDPTGKIDLNDPATRDKIRTLQGAGAGAIVNEAQGKSLALPF